MRGSTTPWGRSDYELQLAPGVRWVGTPSHGGLMLAQRVALGLSDYALGIGEPCAGGYAYEEDCAYAAVFAERPDLARAMEEESARSSYDSTRYAAEAMLSKSEDELAAHYAAIRDHWFGDLQPWDGKPSRHSRADLEELGRLRRALPGIRPGMTIVLAGLRGHDERRYTVTRGPRPIHARDAGGKMWRIPPSMVVGIVL